MSFTLQNKLYISFCFEVRNLAARAGNALGVSAKININVFVHLSTLTAPFLNGSKTRGGRQPQISKTKLLRTLIETTHAPPRAIFLGRLNLQPNLLSWVGNKRKI
jgi:hypothetical protein